MLSVWLNLNISSVFQNVELIWLWWCALVLLALGRWRQEGLEFKIILCSVVSLMLVWDTRRPVYQKEEKSAQMNCFISELVESWKEKKLAKKAFKTRVWILPILSSTVCRLLAQQLISSWRSLFTNKTDFWVSVIKAVVKKDITTPQSELLCNAMKPPISRQRRVVSVIRLELERVLSRQCLCLRTLTSASLLICDHAISYSMYTLCCDCLWNNHEQILLASWVSVSTSKTKGER